MTISVDAELAALIQSSIATERNRIARELRMKAVEYQERADVEMLRTHPFIARVRGLRQVAANLMKQANRIASNVPLCQPKEGPT